MTELFTPIPSRVAMAVHSAGHCNALVENPFDEVDAAQPATQD